MSDSFTFSFGETNSTLLDATDPAASFDEPVDLSGVFHPLEERTHRFHDEQRRRLQEYAQKATFMRTKQEDILLFLDGWETNGVSSPKEALETLMPREEYPTTCGGFYFRTNGKGIAVNPGVNFLKRLHEAGLYITDIDHVVITQNLPSAYADLKAVYTLNHQCNLASPSFHLIEYHLHQGAHQRLATFLRPHFKQEKGSVKSLDLFVDSINAESIAITEDVKLSFLPASPSQPQSLIALFEADGLGKLAYVPAIPQSDEAAQLVEGADLMLLELPQNQEFSDSFILEPVIQFIQKCAPKLLLCSRFLSGSGDNRLEIVRLIREKVEDTTVALPVDQGLKIKPNKLDILCSLSGRWTPFRQIRVVKTGDSFKPLNFLSHDMML